MKTYKGQTVPEGATHYSEVSNLNPFYKYTDNYFGYYNCKTNNWVQLVYSWAEDYSLVKLMTTAAWMPKTGTYCEVLFKGIWAQAFYVGRKEDGSQLFEGIEGDRIIPEEIRGYKTDRQKFIEKGESCVSIGLMEAMLGSLYDNGARFVESE